MPKIERRIATISTEPTELPRNLRPFDFHKIDLGGWQGKDQVPAECPFCGELKFSIAAETGLWDCKRASCGKRGNSLTFLRQLWEESLARTTDWSELWQDRRLLDPGTLIAWGACKSIITGEWLLPAWSPEGKLHQLYRRHKLLERGRWKWNLSPTPGVWKDGDSHGLFGPTAEMISGKRAEEGQATFYCEGPWDGMAFWEALRGMGLSDPIVAVPGANVFKEEWTQPVSGRRAVLLFDSDHPKPNPATSELQAPVGWAGMRRASRAMLSHEAPPSEIDCIWWGEGGFDPQLSNGWDVRDHLSMRFGREDDGLSFRKKQLERLLALVKPIPQEWREGVAIRGQSPKQIEPEPCSSWKELLSAWEKALAMRQSIEDVLSVMLAVVASTVQVGDQLFLQVVGSAGSGKSRLCDGLVVSKHCHLLLHMTGFHSGFNDGTDHDYSLLSRINGKCLVTPEGDVMMSSANFEQIMSQQRQIFDGKSGASYKNKKVDLLWTGLRTPWIMAGTPALLDADQSRLGDRFLKVFIEDPSESGRAHIGRMVCLSSIRSVRQTSNCDPTSTVDGTMLAAYRLTGGYVDWLRSNVSDELAKLRFDENELSDWCWALAEFTAAMRARPLIGIKHRDKIDQHDAKELPTRLASQYCRLAMCLAVVLNRSTIDDEVRRRVRKVALDTSTGVTVKVVDALARAGLEGADANDLQIVSNLTEEKLHPVLRFLSTEQVAVLESFEERPEGYGRGFHGTRKWRLTEKMARLHTIARPE